ncbi:MAG TPA: ABC transporter permease [Vicinamibacterales bacterium]|jgi:predicted permease
MMQWIRLFVSRMWATLSRTRVDREFEEELSSHLQLLIDEYERQGLSRSDARREAIRRLGQPRFLREQHLDQSSFAAIDSVAQDLRYALRMLRKSPAFTAIATLSLAIGIGANTALFSLVDHLLLRSLPVREPDRLVKVQQAAVGPGLQKRRLEFPPPMVDAIRAETRIVSEVAGFTRLDRPAVTIDGVPEASREVERVSGDFFRSLGVVPILGRAPEESDEGAAVVSFGLWRARFDSRADVIGRRVSVNGESYTIVGVAPRRFFGVSIEHSTDLWISSLAAVPLAIVARLAPGVTAPQAEAALQSVISNAFPPPPNDFPLRMELLPAGRGTSLLREQYERPLLALTALVTVLLLITCTNVGSLLMVRNTARRRELTVRVALGARRTRLISHYLVESLLLAVAGGTLALVFARWGVSTLLATLPLAAAPESLAFEIDGRTLGFTAGVSLLSALLFGLAPAWRATHIDLTALRSIQGSTSTPNTRRLGRVLVASQVALSVVLLVGAGLFLQTLRNLTRSDVGFNPERLMQVSIDTRSAGYGEGQVGAVYRLLLERVGGIPGVASVTGIRNPVMRHSLSRCMMQFASATLASVRMASDEPWQCADVGPSFFETMGIPVLQGRAFTAADFDQDRRFIVVNEAFAKRYFPNQDPIALQIGIIGIVGNTKLAGVRAERAPMTYQQTRREPDRINALEVRAAGDPRAVVDAIRAEVQRVNPRLFLEIRTMRQEIDRDIAKERMVAAASAFFSLLGLLLVSIGIFGVASYTVAQRTTELGIRMALGASRRAVIGASLRDTMLVFGAGLAAGIVAAIAAVRFTASLISDLLFGLTATDVTNLVGAVLVMVAVACAACVLPARRATRIDPLGAIRCE